jgi:hypothetical protein
MQIDHQTNRVSNYRSIQVEEKVDLYKCKYLKRIIEGYESRWLTIEEQKALKEDICPFLFN